MHHEEVRQRSRWILRAMEWDDARARYPNLWHDGMPRHILAYDRIAHRLHLGDLIAIYYPASQKHAERSERYLGLCRVVGIREADDPAFAWVDLRTEHRFDAPVRVGEPPRRVFLCCDPGWPEPEVRLFTALFDAAVEAGWQPGEGDRLDSGAVDSPPPAVSAAPSPRPADPVPAGRPPVEEPPEADDSGRVFAGADFSGDMRDPRDRTWLAIVQLVGERLRVRRLEATGRHGLERILRDPDSLLMRAEAIGLDFPFGLPVQFAEHLFGGPFPEEGWWALARRFEELSRPEYLSALQDFRSTQGEPKRLTDERHSGASPLHRVQPDMGPMTFHGIRMIAEDRSRYVVRPFESAQGQLLIEVYPGALVRRLELDREAARGAGRNEAILQAITTMDSLPVDLDASQRRACLDRRDALDAVMAARLTAAAVIGGEVERAPESLIEGEGERIRREGWIYGLAD